MKLFQKYIKLLSTYNIILSAIILHVVFTMLNFKSALWKQPLTLINFTITIFIIAFWCFILFLGFKLPNKLLFTYITYFWLIGVIGFCLDIFLFYLFGIQGVFGLLTMFYVLPFYGLAFLGESISLLILLMFGTSIITICLVAKKFRK